MKIIAPHSNTTLQPIERILFVLRPWLSRPSRLGGWLAARRQAIEYRANPRSIEYMLERAREFKDRHAIRATADLLVVNITPEQIPAIHREWLRRIVTTAPAADYDTIVLLYPDAIGLGWEKIERAMRRLSARQFLVLNGRRRVFVWDDASRRALSVRRFFVRAMLLEGISAPMILGGAIILALADGVTGRARE